MSTKPTSQTDDFTRRVAEILCVIYYGDDSSEENDDWIADWLPVAREAIRMAERVVIYDRTSGNGQVVGNAVDLSLMLEEEQP